MRSINISRKDKRRIDAEIAELTSRSDFQNIVDKIRKEIGYSQKKYNANGSRKLGEIHEGVTEIIYKFNLHEKWRPFIENYIVSNKKDPDFDPEAIEVSLDSEEYNDVEKPARVKILIGPKNSLLDLKEAYTAARKILDNYKPKNKRARNWPFFQRDTEIFECHERGLKSKEILKELYPKYTGIDLGQIKKIISEYKKKLNKRNQDGRLSSYS